jgi:hypothetical protein
MKREPSILAGLVITYHERFGRHVPEPEVRRVDAGLLAALIQDSLATGVPTSDGEFGWVRPPEYGPGGCILRDDIPGRTSRRKKRRDGERPH